jgi:hypothetical protein
MPRAYWWEGRQFWCREGHPYFYDEFSAVLLAVQIHVRKTNSSGHVGGGKSGPPCLGNGMNGQLGKPEI